MPLWSARSHANCAGFETVQEVEGPCVHGQLTLIVKVTSGLLGPAGCW